MVDIHAHFLLEDYVSAATAAGHGMPDGNPAWPSWTAAEHLRLMDRAGIERSMLSISSPGVHFGDDAAAARLARLVNEHASRIVASHAPRFGFFASLPLPDPEAALAEIDHAFDALGAEGVVLLSSPGGHYPDEERYEPVLAELNRRRAVVFLHPTTPPGCGQLGSILPAPLLEFLFDTARAVIRLHWRGSLRRYPGLRWIVPHAGGVLPLLTERAEMVRRLAADRGLVEPSGPAWMPTAAEESWLGRCWFDLAGTPFPSQVPALLRLVDESRLLYGSDYCWSPQPAVLRQLASIEAAAAPRTAATWRALLARNAADAFGTGASTSEPCR